MLGGVVAVKPLFMPYEPFLLWVGVVFNLLNALQQSCRCRRLPNVIVHQLPSPLLTVKRLTKGPSVGVELALANEKK